MLCNFCFTSRKAALFALLAVALLAAVPVGAQQNAMNDWHGELPQAQAVGQGEFRWFGLSIYGATLWSSHKPFDRHAPFALQLTYHRHIGAQRFVDTSIDEMRRLAAKNNAPLSADQLRKWESYLSRTFPDVSNGDQLIGIFIPGKGCRFYSRDRLLSEIDDPEFADAFFSIWLDPQSRDSELREQLLGQKK